MPEFHTSRRLSAQAHAAHIEAARAAGQHVVAEFAFGLHLMSTQAFDNEAAALAALKAPAETGDCRAYFPPAPALGGPPPFTLDQLAHLGGRSVGDPEPDFVAGAV